MSTPCLCILGGWEWFFSGMRRKGCCPGKASAVKIFFMAPVPEPSPILHSHLTLNSSYNSQKGFSGQQRWGCCSNQVPNACSASAWPRVGFLPRNLRYSLCFPAPTHPVDMTAYLTHYLPAIHSSERCSRVAMLVELHKTIGIVSSCLVEKKKKKDFWSKPLQAVASLLFSAPYLLNLNI